MADAKRNLVIEIGAKANPSLKKAFKSINKSLSKAVTKAAQFGKAFGVAAAGGIALGTREALAFDKKMREVSTMLGDNVSIMKEYNAQLKEMAIESGKAPVELAEGLRQVLSAGIPAAEAMEFLNVANKGAIGGAAETVEAVDLLTGVINAYGLEASEAGRISDIVFQSIKDGKTTYTELASSMGAVLPFAAQLGVSLEDLFAATTTLTKGSIETVNATTFLKNVMAQVISASDAQKQAAASLGIAFDSASIKAMGFQKWLAQIQEKAGGNEKALSKLFPSIRAITAVLSLTGKQAKEFASIQENMAHSTGVADAAFDRMQSGAGAQVERTLNGIRVAGQIVGEKIIPKIGEAIDALGGPTEIAKGLVQVFDDMVAGLKEIARVIQSSVILQNLFELGERTGNLISGQGFTTGGGVDLSPGENIAAQAEGVRRFEEMQRRNAERDARARETGKEIGENVDEVLTRNNMKIKNEVKTQLQRTRGAEAVLSGL